jgi:hypothetical protein
VDVPALRAQLEALAAAGEHVQVIATLFELLTVWCATTAI